ARGGWSNRSAAGEGAGNRGRSRGADPQLIVHLDTQPGGRVTVADRDGQLAIGVLVDEQLTELDIGERPYEHRLVRGSGIDLDRNRMAQLQAGAAELLMADVELDVAEA